MVGLGDKIKYHNIFEPMPLFQYCDNVGITIGTFTNY